MTVGKIFEKYCLSFCFPFWHCRYYFYLLSNLDLWHDFGVPEFPMSTGNHSGTLVLPARPTLLEPGLPHGSSLGPELTGRTAQTVKGGESEAPAGSSAAHILAGAHSTHWVGCFLLWGLPVLLEESTQREKSLFINVSAKNPEIRDPRVYMAWWCH